MASNWDAESITAILIGGGWCCVKSNTQQLMPVVTAYFYCSFSFKFLSIEWMAGGYFMLISVFTLWFK